MTWSMRYIGFLYEMMYVRNLVWKHCYKIIYDITGIQFCLTTTCDTHTSLILTTSTLARDDLISLSRMILYSHVFSIEENFWQFKLYWKHSLIQISKGHNYSYLYLLGDPIAREHLLCGYYSAAGQLLLHAWAVLAGFHLWNWILLTGQLYLDTFN